MNIADKIRKAKQKKHIHKWRYEDRIIGGKLFHNVKVMDCKTDDCPNVRVHKRLGFKC